MVWVLASLAVFWIACEAAIVWLVSRQNRREPQDRRERSPLEDIMATHDLNFLAILKGSERYVFLYEDGREQDLLRTFGRFASNPELSFTWYNAAVLSQKVRESIAEIQRAKANETPAANRRF